MLTKELRRMGHPLRRSKRKPQPLGDLRILGAGEIEEKHQLRAKDRVLAGALSYGL